MHDGGGYCWGEKGVKVARMGMKHKQLLFGLCQEIILSHKMLNS